MDDGEMQRPPPVCASRGGRWLRTEWDRLHSVQPCGASLGASFTRRPALQRLRDSVVACILMAGREEEE